jgi:hypothetical protein
LEKAMLHYCHEGNSSVIEPFTVPLTLPSPPPRPSSNCLDFAPAQRLIRTSASGLARTTLNAMMRKLGVSRKDL